jgi:hypothetical protein
MVVAMPLILFLLKGLENEIKTKERLEASLHEIERSIYTHGMCVPRN